MWWKFLRWFLFRLDPEWAHALGAQFLRLRGFVTQGQTKIPRVSGWKAEIAGIPLDSPLGLAAGFDKDAKLVLGLRSLGFGFIEVGTVTPRPQDGNARPRLFRLPEARALINRMGFNSEGAEEVAARLNHLRAFAPVRFPIGVNLGKNRDTPLDRAGEDYVTALDHLYSVADYLVVNLSSPNTPGLTSLQEGDLLTPLLKQVREARDRNARRVAGHLRALFLKLSPDLTPEARRKAVEAAVAEGYGIIASNTSRRRDFPELAAANARIVAEEGGLSGAPLREMAVTQLKEIRGWAGPKATIISVGGLASAQD
ncbi:MAG: quinone-dependent dihydroorotate dehydrogenase, partial [Bdellovibrionota bacterium]